MTTNYGPLTESSLINAEVLGVRHLCLRYNEQYKRVIFRMLQFMLYG